MRGPVFAGVVLTLLLAPPLGWAGKGNDAGKPKDAKREGEGDAGSKERPVGPKGSRDVLVEDSPFEALEVACLEGKGASCREAGLSWKEGRLVVRPDLQRAETFFRSGCYFGDGASCLLGARMYLSMEAGMLLRLPKGIPELDFGTAAQLLDLGCDLGERVGCGLGGDLHLDPTQFLPRADATFRDLEPDPVRALQSWEQGCPEDPGPGGDSSRDLRSCVRLGELHERGGVAGVRRDPDRAKSYYARACAKDPQWCERSGPSAAVSDERQAEPPSDRAWSSPDVSRFQEPGEGKTPPRARVLARIDAVLQVGGRWNVLGPRAAGPWLGLGTTIWANFLGIHLETGWWSDRPFEPDERTWSHYVHGLGLRLAFPLPIDLPIRARFVLGPMVLGHLGHLKQHGGPAAWTGGASEGAWIQLSSAPESGPRQWFALEFSLSQATGTRLPEPVIGQRLLLLVGFGGGGHGPELGGRRLFDEAQGILVRRE